ncbi:hypothetical protein SAMN04487760_10951 [Lachnospiraceae bacterium G41]|nr:hypothetical protein SAMN04487760_10951 [Lachnospiraceae bacterium G41]
MKKKLFVGFKGKNNSSSMLVSSISSEHFLLTNSFEGVRKDIDELFEDYDEVYLFGADKNLSDSFRIERLAEKGGKRLKSKLDLEKVKEQFASFMIKAEILNTPTKYLCNDAYWYLLEKYKGNAVLIHIPTVKNFKEEWISDVKKAIKSASK